MDSNLLAVQGTQTPDPGTCPIPMLRSASYDIYCQGSSKTSLLSAPPTGPAALTYRSDFSYGFCPFQSEASFLTELLVIKDVFESKIAPVLCCVPKEEM
jgi:hypothetical protein